VKPSERVLIVDDEPGIRSSLSEILADEGYFVEAVESGEACLEILQRKAFQCVLLDIWLPGIDGLETLEGIEQIDATQRPAVVVISGHGKIETAVRATKLGAFDFLEKPLSLDKVVLTVKNALVNRRLTRQNEELQSEGIGYSIIGESVPMKALRGQLELMAPTSGRVLIFGESGVGKELVAHALHARSLRAGETFVEVNCAAIPEELIESELFGHVKGSFTGAVEDKTGKFQQADRGTLFLDEVGDMSLNTQAKVLRALESQRFEPVGSGRRVEVDVRVIAATNKNLEEEISSGNFREDLFYRLNVIPFFVPPLRSRAEDIPQLAEYFLGHFCRAYGRKPKHLSVDAIESLMGYAWPGNVRELRNLMERIVIMHAPERVDTDDLPLPGDPRRTAPRTAAGEFRPLAEFRAASERRYVLEVLEAEGGNMTRTAEALGLERSHLYRKMKSLGISASDAKD
jgi:two-component system, NtrC family, nitrogen regulation response regulator NtrX